jgi:hypothetical protein
LLRDIERVVEVKGKESFGVLEGVGFGLDFARLSYICTWHLHLDWFWIHQDIRR